MIKKENGVAGFLAKEEEKVNEDNEAKAKIKAIQDRLKDKVVSKEMAKVAESGDTGVSSPIQNVEIELHKLLHKRESNPRFLEILFVVFESQHETIIKELAEKLVRPITRSNSDCL